MRHRYAKSFCYSIIESLAYVKPRNRNSNSGCQEYKGQLVLAYNLPSSEKRNENSTVICHHQSFVSSCLSREYVHGHQSISFRRTASKQHGTWRRRICSRWQQCDRNVSHWSLHYIKHNSYKLKYNNQLQ